PNASQCAEPAGYGTPGAPPPEGEPERPDRAQHLAPENDADPRDQAGNPDRPEAHHDPEGAPLPRRRPARSVRPESHASASPGRGRPQPALIFFRATISRSTTSLGSGA